ncbi:phage portal protein [Nocardia sp. NPDC057440]|uniref:phage portal protein n=1 Tax=Nocardia sp. NPDC057440 TaxID=3346134 RepID=UPI00366F5CCC
MEISIDTWASYHKYGSNTFGLGGGGPYSKSEEIDNDFVGYVNGAYKASGVVFAACLARMMIFSEARFVFQKVKNAKPGDVIDTPALDLLDTPWPNGTTGEMLARAIQDIDLCGNHYMLRQHEIGKGPRLRRLRPDWVTIVLSKEPSEALDCDVLGYIYKPGNTDVKAKWEVFPIDGSNGVVAHWSPIPDPDALYRGMSWMTPVIREIQSDKAISKHKLKFFEKGATPNIAVSLHESVSVEEFKEFKEVMDAQYNGLDNAYKTMYLGGGADVTSVGANIQQLDFATVTGIGESRIAAAARVHPTLLGITPGLGGSSLNEGNFDAAKDAFASGTMRPLWRSLCAAYSVLVTPPDGYRLWYSDKDISFLREDRQKVAMRQQTDATTISRYVMQGFKPESAVAAVLEDDLSLLDHTGLYSVQLLPPEISFADVNAAKKEKEGDDQEKSTDKPSKANNQPTGSKRKPVGRPPKESKDAWLDAVERGEPWEDEL